MNSRDTKLVQSAEPDGRAGNSVGVPSAAREVVCAMRGIAKTYVAGEVRIQALDGIDLDLYKGEFVVLLGASGSGKSTFLNILGGLDTPSSGWLHYLDHDLTSADDKALQAAKEVAMECECDNAEDIINNAVQAHEANKLQIAKLIAEKLA